MPKRLFSAMQPTGELHIGNWLGALKNWVRLQNEYEAVFSIVDYHAITIPFDQKEMQKKTLNLAMDYLAAGIDPKSSIIFVQSQISEHTELAWILSTLASFGDLQRMIQFKEKSKEHPESINVGLFNYPILQAADILLYKASVVPVGEDQKQHIELTRVLARKFNQRFGKTFLEPEVILTKGYRIMGLTSPKKKMSKSYGPDNYIALNDSPEMTWRKLAKAITDPNRKRRTDKGDPKKCNLYSLHQLFSSLKEQRGIFQACRNASFGCLDCKRILAKNINQELIPFREKRKILEKDLFKIKKILEEGASKARKIAKETLKEAKSKMGLLYDKNYDQCY